MTTKENVSVSILPSGYGHWSIRVSAVVDGKVMTKSITTSNSRLVDDLKDDDHENYEGMRIELATELF